MTGAVARSEACPLGIRAAPSSILTSSTFFRFGHEIISTAILPLPLIVRPMKSNKGANYRAGCTPSGTKVSIYHFKAESILNAIYNVVKLKTCAVSS